MTTNAQRNLFPSLKSPPAEQRLTESDDSDEDYHFIFFKVGFGNRYKVYEGYCPDLLKRIKLDHTEVKKEAVVVKEDEDYYFVLVPEPRFKTSGKSFHFARYVYSQVEPSLLFHGSLLEHDISCLY